jgi:hypothetical protein
MMMFSDWRFEGPAKDTSWRFLPRVLSLGLLRCGEDRTNERTTAREERREKREIHSHCVFIRNETAPMICRDKLGTNAKNRAVVWNDD